MRGAVATGVLVLALAVPVAPAVANPCSEGPEPPPRIHYEQADAVALGVITELPDGGHRMLIRRSLKGDLPREILLPKAYCGRWPTHRFVGWFMDRRYGEWHLDPVPADVARAAARPLQRTGSGPAVLLEQTGSYRNPLMALDQYGRLLHSSHAGRRYRGVDVCPGGAVALAWRRDGVSDVLSLPELRRIGRGPRLTAGAPPEGSSAWCADPAGRLAFVDVMRRSYEHHVGWAQVGFRRTIAVYDGDLFVSYVSPRLMIVHNIRYRRSDLLQLIDPSTGREILRQRASQLAPWNMSSDYRFMTTTLPRDSSGKGGGLVIADLHAARPRFRRLASSRALRDFAWVDSSRLALLGKAGLARIVDPMGHEVGRVRGIRHDDWFPYTSERWLFGVRQSRATDETWASTSRTTLLRVPSEGGVLRVVGRLPMEGGLRALQPPG